ncbi:EboA domain-containing protein [Longispora sp. K20-0274]|uniref:EboA domain-containing protein n=1 Tax=Longispora sp. K20-0274 TaxID=3088255 RepID=UPI00399BD09A
MTPDRLRAAFVAVRDRDWLVGALIRVSVEPGTIVGYYSVARRRCGHMDLPDAPGWTADTAARVLLLTVLPWCGRRLTDVVRQLYEYGDMSEKYAALRALPMLDVGPSAVPVLRDALRSHEPRLLAAAMGPYSAHLDDAAWREAVLACALEGVPLAVVHDLHGRADDRLASMLAAHAADCRAAGHPVSPDVAALLHRLTGPGTGSGPGGDGLAACGEKEPGVRPRPPGATGPRVVSG